MNVDLKTYETLMIHPSKEKDRWNGEKYHHNSGQQQVVADMLIKQYPFNPYDEILDIGCGAGDVTDKLAKQVPHGKVLGVDPSQSMLDYAQEKFANHAVQFQLGKASELSFHHQFNVIFSSSCLHWETKQKEALLCFKEALRPGGAIVLAIPGPDQILRLALTETTQSSKWSSFFVEFESPGKIWTANEYAALLLETEFIIQKIEVVMRPHYFEHEKDYIEFVEAMLPHMSRIPISSSQEFLKDILEGVKRHGALNEFNQLKFEVKVLEVIAFSPK